MCIIETDNELYFKELMKNLKHRVEEVSIEKISMRVFLIARIILLNVCHCDDVEKLIEISC